MRTKGRYSALDDALEIIHRSGPDLRNGLTNHAPMAVEAMCAMGRADAVAPWIGEYRKGMACRPEPRERIDAARWQSALAQLDRFADWNLLFDEELKRAPWRDVLDRWVGLLAPGISAAATHGVIRTAHAVRGLAEDGTPPRLAELAEGFAYWAATYQELPHPPGPKPQIAMAPRDAIQKVTVVPKEQRRFRGTITSSLEALDDFPEFAPVIGLIDVNAGGLSQIISQLTETFAKTYLANAHDFLSAIVFIHSVTSTASLRMMLPHLQDKTARDAARFAWQAGCALYAAFGTTPRANGEIEPPRESAETLIDIAIENGDEHAIKFTEACLREHSLNPSDAYLAAARHASATLRAS